MRFLAIVSLFVMAVSAAETEGADLGQSAIAGPEARAVEAIPAGTTIEHLQKRKCTYNGCKCQSRGKQFHSCGNCVWTSDRSWVITQKRVASHIFECSPSGDCCDYGPADDCGGSSARCYKTD